MSSHHSRAAPELQTLFDYELCAVPASINDEYGCLRTGTKSTLVSKLKVDDLQLDAPDIVIVDGQQLIYHFVGHVLDLLQISPRRINSVSTNQQKCW